MQIFPNSSGRKKDLYPSYTYLRKGAQFTPGAEQTEEPVDDAFEAIKDLPMFGDGGAAPDSGALPGAGAPGAEGLPPAEVPVAEEGGLPGEGVEAAPGDPAAAVDKAMAAVEEAATAISEVADAVKGDAAPVAEVEVEVEDIGGKKDEECKEGDKSEECKDKPKDKPKDDSKPDFLKKEGDPAEACAETKKPAVKKDEAPKAEKPDAEAKSIGGFIRVADLSSQTKKEVYDYYRALGMPEEWCKSLVKDY